MSIENINIGGTVTGRISSKKRSTSNTPKSDRQFQQNEDGDLYCESGMVGLHLGPRTKKSHQWSYDPLLVFETGQVGESTAYSDRLARQRSKDIRKLMAKHFGDEGDYYNHRSPDSIQNFLRDLLGHPNLTLTRIEEHCDQSSGYPCWRFDYIRGDAPVQAPTAPGA